MYRAFHRTCKYEKKLRLHLVLFLSITLQIDEVSLSVVANSFGYNIKDFVSVRRVKDVVIYIVEWTGC